MSEAEAVLLTKLKPGTKWRISFGSHPQAERSRLYHVLAIVDEQRIVVKHWLRHKRRFHYEVELPYWFWLFEKDGRLERVY